MNASTRPSQPTPQTQASQELPLALPGRWRDEALCRRFVELPWIADAGQVCGAARLAMAAVCHACPVFEVCQRYVLTHEVTAGFWAGRMREVEHGTGGAAA
jgi:hypothetical protein